MHPLALTFLVALPAVAAILIATGDGADRTVASAMLAAFALTLAIRAAETTRFGHLSIGVMVVDASLEAVVAWMAVRTERWWTILTASLLVLPLLGHFAKLLEPDLWPGGYWLMTNAPAPPCVLLMGVGALQACRRRRRNAAAISLRCSAVAPTPARRRND